VTPDDRPSKDAIDPRVLQALLAAHLAMVRAKLPTYQADMLTSLRSLWRGRHERLLDVGSGTGVIAEAMAQLLPVGEVQALDLVDRFCPTLAIACQTYDGQHIPFADGHFDAATLNNVLHHVPVEARAGLLSEIRRVTNGPLYVKDHEQQGMLDRWRLTALDAIGNIPFGGMLWARYLTRAEWEALVRKSGWRIAARATPRAYRRGPYALLFPNRLEITLRLERA